MFDNLRKYAAAYAVAVGGILLTCLSSWNVREELASSHLREFQWAASDRIESLRAFVDQGLDALLEIRGLLYAAGACSTPHRKSMRPSSASLPMRSCSVAPIS